MAENKSAVLGALTETEDIINRISKNVKDMLVGSLQEQVSTQLSEDFNKEDEESEENTETSVDDIDTASSNDEAPVGDELPVDGDEIPSVGDESGEAPIDGEEGIDSLSVDSVDAPVDSDVSDVVADVVDATGLNDDELVQIFKKVTDDTEIEVVKNDDGTIDIKKDGQEYIIKINEDKESFLDNIISGGGNENEDEPVVGDAPEAGAEDTIYEITLGETTDDTPKEGEEELDETRVHTVGHAQIRKPEGFLKYASSRLRSSLKESVDEQNTKLITEATTLRNDNATLLKENTDLKDELSKHKDGLTKMNQYLNEALVLNQKIFHVNKLFCEHATTKDEKKSILERFDDKSITTEKDIKNLYKTISSELKVDIKESVESKLSNSIGSTGESLLTESKNQDGSLDRVKELMYGKK